MTYRPVGKGRGAVEAELGRLGEVKHGIVGRGPGVGDVGGGRSEVPVDGKQFLHVLGKTLAVHAQYTHLLHLIIYTCVHLYNIGTQHNSTVFYQDREDIDSMCGN